MLAANVQHAIGEGEYVIGIFIYAELFEKGVKGAEIIAAD